MSKLIAITFEDQATAFELRTDLVHMQGEYLLALDDAVVVTMNERGKPKLHQAINLTAAGATNGGFWGLLIGAIFLNPLLGTAIGAGTGALTGALTDLGIDDRFMKDVGKSLAPNHATVFVLVRDLTEDKVLEGLQKYRGKGKVMTTSLSRKDEQALRDVLEVA
ncbi:MAG: DUF1269 domain-containing protein [Hyphomicrobiaceae bacterium]